MHPHIEMSMDFYCQYLKKIENVRENKLPIRLLFRWLLKLYIWNLLPCFSNLGRKSRSKFVLILQCHIHHTYRFFNLVSKHCEEILWKLLLFAQPRLHFWFCRWSDKIEKVCIFNPLNDIDPLLTSTHDHAAFWRNEQYQHIFGKKWLHCIPTFYYPQQ